MQVTVTIRTVEQKFPGGTVGGSYRIDLALARPMGPFTGMVWETWARGDIF